MVCGGDGSAVVSASITWAEAGRHGAVIGSVTIGGTCVNFGFVPSKAIIRAVDSIHHANAAPMRFKGIEARAAIADWSQVVAEKDRLVSDLRQAKYADLLPLYNRSEEHTSELQSLMRISYAVFCLKKKKITQNIYNY